MTRISIAAAIAALFFTQGCRRTDPVAATPSQDRACLVTMTAESRDDADIAKLQQDLRERRAPARAAEQLGYRFISKARMTNDAGFYTVAEQAAGCLDSIQHSDPAALLLRGHVLHPIRRVSKTTCCPTAFKALCPQSRSWRSTLLSLELA